MGVPLFQAKRLVERHDVTVLSSNYALYGDLSERVMSILAAEAPRSEDRVPRSGVRALRSTRAPAGRAGTFRLPRWAA